MYRELRSHRCRADRGFNCYFPMPFHRKAKITLENQHVSPIPAFFYQIDYGLVDSLPEDTMYFHAQWRRQKITEKGKDYVILDGVHGSGHYVGTYLALTTLERYWWGEGEVKFYLDGDEDYPTICGTRHGRLFWRFLELRPSGETERRWNRITPCRIWDIHIIPGRMISFTTIITTTTVCRCAAFYRWHILDPVCFEENLRVTLQQIGVGHRGLFERQDDVATVAYWYQSETAHCLRAAAGSAGAVAEVI